MDMVENIQKMLAKLGKLINYVFKYAEPLLDLDPADIKRMLKASANCLTCLTNPKTNNICFKIRKDKEQY